MELKQIFAFLSNKFDETNNKIDKINDRLEILEPKVSRLQSTLNPTSLVQREDILLEFEQLCEEYEKEKYQNQNLDTSFCTTFFEETSTIVGASPLPTPSATFPFLPKEFAEVK